MNNETSKTVTGVRSEDWFKLLYEISKLYAVIDEEWADATIENMDEFDPWDALLKLAKRDSSQSAEVERLSKERDDALANADFWELELNNFRRNAAHRAEQLAEEKVEAAESKLSQLQLANDAAIEAENRRWQDAIYEACKAVAVECGKPTHAIDGGGSDSGDGLDFTLEEIAQAFDILREAKCADYERLREALENLFAMVNGECPSLLEGHHLWVEITDVLTPAAPCATTSSEIVAARKQEDLISKITPGNCHKLEE